VCLLAAMKLVQLLVPPVAVLGSSTNGPVVSTRSGLSYRGLYNVTSGQDYFLGVRFAQPPVGPLRFKPPVPWSPAGNTTAVVDATRLGDSCEQAVEYSSNTISEDCLTLNICEFPTVSSTLQLTTMLQGSRQM
jgi:carboxylesterase type B